MFASPSLAAEILLPSWDDAEEMVVKLCVDDEWSVVFLHCSAPPSNKIQLHSIRLLFTRLDLLYKQWDEYAHVLFSLWYTFSSTQMVAPLPSAMAMLDCTLQLVVHVCNANQKQQKKLSKGQPVNTGSPGKMTIKTVSVNRQTYA